MFRFQYCVTTKASRKLAWDVFSNWRRWNEFANIYGQLYWREGRPWEAGSRLDIEVLDPVRTVVSHVITRFTETWYENFRCACDRLAEANTA